MAEDVYELKNRLFMETCQQDETIALLTARVEQLEGQLAELQAAYDAATKSRDQWQAAANGLLKKLDSVGVL